MSQYKMDPRKKKLTITAVGAKLCDMVTFCRFDEDSRMWMCVEGIRSEVIRGHLELSRVVNLVSSPRSDFGIHATKMVYNMVQRST